ncbi:MAG: TetR/AcrR family transcriptional regulator [Clostridiaceae bacterium]|nr:TetR/AcrR family transcriptional regulator [Clostridiaceae bacterium]
MMKKNPEETKDRIKEAFLKLYKEKRIEKISIAELTKEAKVYRGTFYYYYQDIYDLLDNIQEEFVKKSAKIVTEVIEGLIKGDLENRIETIVNALKEYDDMLVLFFVDKVDIVFINKIKNIGKHKIISMMGIDESNLTQEVKYTLEYLASAQIGIITKWLENKRDIEPAVLGRIIQKINLNGAITCLKELRIKS